MHAYLVVYDVSTEDKEGEKRLRKVANICLDYGIRVQKSVFECVLNEKQYKVLLDQLIKCLDPKEDSLRIYKLTLPIEKQVKVYGVQTAILTDQDDPIIL